MTTILNKEVTKMKRDSAIDDESSFLMLHKESKKIPLDCYRKRQYSDIDLITIVCFVVYEVFYIFYTVGQM
jgi:hypothetical protein